LNSPPAHHKFHTRLKAIKKKWQAPLFGISVQSQDLTKTVMADPDIIRCVKEILIDNSITSLSLGSKSDLILKLGMKIVSTDSQNRIENRMEANARANARAKAKAQEQGQAETEAIPLNEVIAAKYQDL